MYNLHLCNLHLFFSRKKPGPTEEEARREGHQGVPDKDFVSLKNSEKKLKKENIIKDTSIYLFLSFVLVISYSFLIRFDIQKLNIRIPLSTQPIQEQLSAMKEMGEEMKNPQPDSMFRSDALISID